MIAKDDRVRRGEHTGTVQAVYEGDGHAFVRFDQGSAGNVPLAELEPADKPLTDDKAWPPTLETKPFSHPSLDVK